MPDQAHLEHLEWLVKHRSMIQQTLFNMYKFMREHPSKLSDATKTQAFALLAGAAFSLWRAVFLTETSRDWSIVEGNLISFLDSVVSDNAITYQDDKRNRAWSVGYYIDDAKLRIEKVITLVRVPKTRTSHVFHWHKEQGRIPFNSVGTSRSDLREEWEWTHAAIDALLHFIDPEFRLPVEFVYMT